MSNRRRFVGWESRKQAIDSGVDLVILTTFPHFRPMQYEYGALSTMTAIMDRMATCSGKVVKWDEALASDLVLSPDRYARDGTPPVVPDENGCYPCAAPGATKTL
jgi:hypothetical protein